MISYISTRGETAKSFEEVVLAGLAADGGLYVPETLPVFSPEEIANLQGLPYPQLFCRILWPFVEGTLTHEEFSTLAEETYAAFTHPATAPLAQLDTRHFVLELFHGPTLAFKDFALQFLGRLLNHLLEKRGEHVTILGATSGDTGSAAIAGCGNYENMRVFILHPHGRPSEVQRRQMTTVLSPNVHNIALKGTFDDCQDIVKALFSNAAFRSKHRLAAVNSINWARIMAQIVYYFYAGLALGAPARRLNFCVPTGNFGDIFAGYLAKRMGLPIEKLIIATNCNDILARTLESGIYGKTGVAETLSPSMDIQISSNFERLLFDLHGRDASTLKGLMQQFSTGGTITLSPAALTQLRSEFLAHRVDDVRTLATIRKTYQQCNYLADPHTAVGIAAAQTLSGQVHGPIITLATAHPAKFPEAVHKATGIAPPLPPHLQDLFDREERFDIVDNSISLISNYIEKHP